MVFLRRVCKAGWQSFKRNILISGAAILILIITLSLITGVILFNTLTNEVLTALQDKVSVGVYFAPNAPEGEILELKASLEDLSHVKSVEYVSRQEALKRFRETHREDATINEALDKLGGLNPLPPSLTIKGATPDEYPAIVKYLTASPYNSFIEEIDYVKRQDAIENLGRVSNSLSKAALIGVAIMALISFLVSFNTLRLAIYSERNKIAIMRLVGASNNFIRGPFVVQGAIYGLTAAFLTLFLFSIFLQLVNTPIENYFQNLQPIALAHYYASNWVQFLGIQLALGIGIGITSSVIAIRKYLKV